MLDSRNLLEGERLNILIDSQSLDSALTNNSPEAIRLFSNIDRSSFEALRSPFNTQHGVLSRVNNFHNRLNNDGHLTGIRVLRSSNRWEDFSFRYDHQLIERLARGIFQKQAFTQDELDALTLVLIWSDYKLKHNGMLVTENGKLLEKRLLLERHRTGRRLLNIVNVSEALEIMDIFAKSKGFYTIDSRRGLKKGLWYFISFRSKVPRYHVVSSEILNSFALRFTHLLRSIDEMGNQYYSGVSCDTMDDMLYHFNYFVSLTTGIFDNLALETRDKYNIKFKGDNIPSRISLQNNAGDKFLKAVRDVNPSIRQHIQLHVDFINLIYNLRELILHRKGLEKLSVYTFKDRDAMWTANFIVISNETLQLLKRSGDKTEKYNILSSWGTREVIYTNKKKICLEPYKFAKAATLKLVEFCGRYLELLGNKDYIQSLPPDDYLVRTIDAFRRFRLGF